MAAVIVPAMERHENRSEKRGASPKASEAMKNAAAAAVIRRVNLRGRRVDPEAKKVEAKNTTTNKRTGPASGMRRLGRRSATAPAAAARRRRAAVSRWLAWSPKTLASGVRGSNGRRSINAASGATGFNYRLARTKSGKRAGGAARRIRQ